MPKVLRIVLSPPNKGTLAKYGLTADTWRRITIDQGYVCPICKQSLVGRKLVVDHQHVRKWKKMKPEQRRLHVRGVLHNFCNRTYVRAFLTIEKAEAVAEYLKKHERRKANREVFG